MPKPGELRRTEALESLALSFKRLVDMAEPFVQAAAEELQTQKKAKGK